MCLFQVEGHAFPVLSKFYCCSRNCSSWPSLCRARSYRLPYRKDQEAYTGRWRGQLLWRFGRDPNSLGTDVTRSDRLKGNVSVTYVTLVPWRRERRRHVPVATVAVPQLSCQVTGSAPQRKHELMQCTCCLLYPHCGVWQPDVKYCMTMSIGSIGFELHSKWIGLTDVTSPFPPSGNEGYILNRDVLLNFLFIKESVSHFRHKY